MGCALSSGHGLYPVVDAMTDDEVRAAIAASHLGGLPPELIGSLIAEARRVHIPAGATIHREGETEPHLELVVRGLVRVHVSAPDGRMMTVRYCRRGALIGTPTLYAVGMERPFGIQALSDSELLRLRPAILRSLADQDLRVARALLGETSERVLSFVAELSGNAFATVRQRLARHLLDLASERQRGPELIAPLTQQELADAIGTVREVVVRVLRELREEGVVRTGRHGIRIHDPERLFGAAVPWGGTNVPDRHAPGN
jgi:CRP/FNR family transcriptional regulator, cyclic AMP receptor protein